MFRPFLSIVAQRLKQSRYGERGDDNIGRPQEIALTMEVTKDAGHNKLKGNDQQYIFVAADFVIFLKFNA